MYMPVFQGIWVFVERTEDSVGDAYGRPSVQSVNKVMAAIWRP